MEALIHTALLKIKGVGTFRGISITHGAAIIEHPRHDAVVWCGKLVGWRGQGAEMLF